MAVQILNFPQEGKKESNLVLDISRENLEAQEEQLLAGYAVKSKGAERLYMENYAPCSRRTEFERDKDRIIYSLAFKRLKDKTQVYMALEGDHYATRMSHTLQVSQTASSIARSLGLNQELTEAIAVGHDLGHTPFGHAVEGVLSSKLADEDGFEHNFQSVFVTDMLEVKKFRDNEAPFGINLTNYTRYGILHHTKLEPGNKIYTKDDDIASSNRFKSLEAELVNKVDTLTYQYHDLEDAIKNQCILQDMKRSNPKLFKGFLDDLNHFTAEACKITGRESSKIEDLWEDYNPNTILKAMIKDLIRGTQNQIQSREITSLEKVQNESLPIVCYDQLEPFIKDFKNFMKKYIYLSPLACQMDDKAKRIADKLFDAFMNDYMQLPYRTRELFEKARGGEAMPNRLDNGYEITPSRVVANYIAGMTDRYALETYRRMFE